MRSFACGACHRERVGKSQATVMPKDFLTTSESENIVWHKNLCHDLAPRYLDSGCFRQMTPIWKSGQSMSKCVFQESNSSKWAEMWAKCAVHSSFHEQTQRHFLCECMESSCARMGYLKSMPPLVLCDFETSACVCVSHFCHQTGALKF